MAVFRFWFLVFGLVVLTTVVVASRDVKILSTADQESDRVTNLPGQPAVNFRHYAGYVKIRPKDEKALFYWFFEAQDKPSEKPLVLWLNGGPGCSSIAYGAAQELGPFLVRNNGAELVLNKFSWNKAANILFLESPVGVGFSYTNKSEDLHNLGDRVTADDSHKFLIEWFKRFPNFKSNSFYISGESYAGHYVPQLAELIFERNKVASKESHINFKGFMIGNAVINADTDQTGFIEYAWSHAIISDDLYHTILKECDFKKDDETPLCSKSIVGFFEAYSNIDIYSIYTPVCLQDDDSTTRKHKLVVSPRFFTKHDAWHKLPSGYDPCTENYVEKYFNREDVQRALHANVTKLSYPYSPCRGCMKETVSRGCDSYLNMIDPKEAILNFLTGDEIEEMSGSLERFPSNCHLIGVIKNWTDSADTVLPIIQKLLNAGLRIWIYSGDTDGRVPVTGTRYSVGAMGLKVSQGWRAWFHRSQVGGWVISYEGGLTLATVRGAGHQVPMFKPAQSLTLVSHFLSGTTLPPSRF